VVEIQDPHDFDPDSITVAAGDTIRFINTGRINHTASLDPEIVRDPDNAVLPDGAEPWDSGDLEPGDEFSVTLTVPGDYVYFCRPHEVLGQIGSITVLEEGEALPASDDDDADDDASPDDDETDDYL
jgi:plastocyanin